VGDGPAGSGVGVGMRRGVALLTGGGVVASIGVGTGVDIGTMGASAGSGTPTISAVGAGAAVASGFVSAGFGCFEHAEIKTTNTAAKILFISESLCFWNRIFNPGRMDCNIHFARHMFFGRQRHIALQSSMHAPGLCPHRDRKRPSGHRRFRPAGDGLSANHIGRRMFCCGDWRNRRSLRDQDALVPRTALRIDALRPARIPQNRSRLHVAGPPGVDLRP